MTIEITVYDAVHVTESLGDAIIRVIQRVRQSFGRARSIAIPPFIHSTFTLMRAPPFHAESGQCQTGGSANCRAFRAFGRN